jgi:hypothetical protein
MTDKLVSTKTSKKLRQSVVEITGFEPDELLIAPVKPPELKNVRPAIHQEQLWLIMIGFVLAVLGLVLLAATSSGLGIILAAVGAFGIALATLVRI